MNKFLEFGNQDPIEFPEGVKPLHFYVLLNNVHNALRDTVHKHPKADVLLQRISEEHPIKMVKDGITTLRATDRFFVAERESDRRLAKELFRQAHITDLKETESFLTNVQTFAERAELACNEIAEKLEEEFEKFEKMRSPIDQYVTPHREWTQEHVEGFYDHVTFWKAKAIAKEAKAKAAAGPRRDQVGPPLMQVAKGAPKGANKAAGDPSYSAGYKILDCQNMAQKGSCDFGDLCFDKHTPNDIGNDKGRAKFETARAKYFHRGYPSVGPQGYPKGGGADGGKNLRMNAALATGGTAPIGVGGWWYGDTGKGLSMAEPTNNWTPQPAVNWTPQLATAPSPMPQTSAMSAHDPVNVPPFDSVSTVASQSDICCCVSAGVVCQCPVHSNSNHDEPHCVDQSVLEKIKMIDAIKKLNRLGKQPVVSILKSGKAAMTQQEKYQIGPNKFVKYKDDWKTIVNGLRDPRTSGLRLHESPQEQGSPREASLVTGPRFFFGESILSDAHDDTHTHSFAEIHGNLAKGQRPSDTNV